MSWLIFAAFFLVDAHASKPWCIAFAVAAVWDWLKEQAEKQRAAKRDRLKAAVHAIYYSAHWTPDRPVDEARLWTDLRDAAEFEPGRSP